MADYQMEQNTGCLERSKIIKIREIVEFYIKLQNCWEQHADMQRILSKLYEKMLFVTDIFALFARKQASLMPAIIICRETDELVQHLFRRLERFEERLAATGEVLNRICIKLKETISLAFKLMKSTLGAEHTEELEGIPVTSMDWLDDVPDPIIDQLADEWEEMNLERQMSNCFNELQELESIKNVFDGVKSSERDERSM